MKGRARDIASWIWAIALTGLLVTILFVLPEPTSFQRSIAHLFIGLTGGVFSYFLSGRLEIKGRIQEVAVTGGGGIGVFVLLYCFFDPFVVKTRISDVAPGVVIPDKSLLRAQKALKDSGRYNGPINGVPTTETRVAIKRVQAESGLPTNGYLDKPTLTHIGDAHRQESAVPAAPVTNYEVRPANVEPRTHESTVPPDLSASRAPAQVVSTTPDHEDVASPLVENLPTVSTYSYPTNGRVAFMISAGDAWLTLNQFSRQANLQLLFDMKVVLRRHTAAVHGEMDPIVALCRMLVDTGLVFNAVNSRTFVITAGRPTQEQGQCQ